MISDLKRIPYYKEGSLICAHVCMVALKNKQMIFEIEVVISLPFKKYFKQPFIANILFNKEMPYNKLYDLKY